MPGERKIIPGDMDRKAEISSERVPDHFHLTTDSSLNPSDVIGSSSMQIDTPSLG